MGKKNNPEINDNIDRKTEENTLNADDGKTGNNAGQDLEERLEGAQKEAAQSYDRFLRVAADLENYKKRATRDMEELRKYANESLLRDLLSVMDNLERAVQSSDDGKNNDSSIIEGVDMTLKERLKILEKNQVKAVVAAGRPFDPAFHQAFMTEESGEHPENTVLKELQKGYTLHNRLLRPAMVVVSKAKSTDATETPEKAAEKR